jgi:predicted nucleic acid-binding protein
LGLSVTGTIGLLLRAKNAGICPKVKPLLDRLRRELNFFISENLYDATLRMAAE